MFVYEYHNYEYTSISNLTLFQIKQINCRILNKTIYITSKILLVIIVLVKGFTLMEIIQSREMIKH